MDRRVDERWADMPARGPPARVASPTCLAACVRTWLRVFHVKQGSGNSLLSPADRLLLPEHDRWHRALLAQKALRRWAPGVLDRAVTWSLFHVKHHKSSSFAPTIGKYARSERGIAHSSSLRS